MSFKTFDSTETRQDYLSLWQDFVSIRVKLFEGELKSFLCDKLYLSMTNINKFLDEFKHYRTQCGVLPHINEKLPFGSLHSKSYSNFMFTTSKILNTSNTSNTSSTSMTTDKKDILLRNNVVGVLQFYVLIWNGLFALMNDNSGQEKDEYYDFFRVGLLETQLYNLITDNDYRNVSASAICNKIVEIVKTWLITQFCRTKVFNSNEEVVKQLGLIGDIDTEFNKLLNYCIKDINLDKIDKYRRYNNSGKHECGLTSFIVNRLVFVVFHDLVMNDIGGNGNDNNNNNNNSNNNNSLNYLKFGKLLNMFKFLYNFSVYADCYPWYDEAYGLSEYIKLRNTLYNMNEIYENRSDGESWLNPTLCNFNYFAFHRWDDGTILHKASYKNYINYTHVLLKDGFDCNKKSPFKKSDDVAPMTPLGIAKAQKFPKLINLFEQVTCCPFFYVPHCLCPLSLFLVVVVGWLLRYHIHCIRIHSKMRMEMIQKMIVMVMKYQK